jgi:hypothetical protein
MSSSAMNYMVKSVKGWIAKGSTSVILYNFEEKAYTVTLEPVPGKRDSIWEFVTGTGPHEVGSYRFDITAASLS